jgi:hypothetical protein
MRRFVLLSGLTLLLITPCCKVNDAEFSFRQTGQGFDLTEKGKPVFSYQQMPKTLTGEYICSNYIHPLYNLNGDTLTQEFPADHPYHRGVFWTWHQLYIDSMSLGDGWINDGISQEVAEVSTELTEKSAKLIITAFWKSDTLPDQKSFMKENTEIIVHPSEKGIRMIDFRIELSALEDNLLIGGSNDPKGYGGFCLRLDIPDDMKFNSEGNYVQPQELQVNAGKWMDFSGSFGKSGKINGIAILCSPQNPLFPSPWILRQKGSMQNAVYPGRDKVKIEKDKPLILKYRLIIHDGNTESVDLNRLQLDYTSEK